MLRKIRGLLLFFLAVNTLVIGAGAFDLPKTNSYTYSTASGTPTALYCPMPFLPEKMIFLNDSAINAQNVADMCFDKDMNLYIVDKGGNSIVKLDQNFQFVKTITGFQNNGVTDSFNAPQDIYITKDGSFYICDTDNQRIVILNKDEALQKIIRSPKSELLKEDFIFRPLKITVDISGNLYLINQNDVNGILQLDADGNFVNYIGSNKVVFNPVDAFWKSIMTNKQLDKLTKAIPIQYTNLSMDEKGFLYVVSASKSEKQPIRRLNLSGTDVLKRNGYVGVVGDVDTVGSDDKSTLKSSFVDIVSGENGLYFALDSSYGRLFAYNQDGYLLYAFGGIGEKSGFFKTPCAVERKGNSLLVLDQANNTLTLFSITEYAELIAQADNCNRNGQYQKSFALWNKVLNYNANYELAYAQIGNVYLEKGDYQKALDYFQLGNFRGDKISQFDGYNMAFAEYSKQVAKKYLGVIIVSFLLVTAVLIAFILFFRKRKRRSVKSMKAGDTDA